MPKLETSPQALEAARLGELESTDSIDLLDLMLILSRQRKTILTCTLVGLLLGLVLAFVLRPTYTSFALILPPQQQQSSAAALLGQIGSLAALTGGGGSSLAGGAAGASLGLKTPADLYVGFLQSRTIADRLIDRFHLMQVYRTKKMEDTRVALKKHVDFEAGKDGLIHISVKDHDPNRASDLANAYVDSLHDLNSTLAITEAAQRRVFFDRELEQERGALSAAENDLQKTQEKTGLIQLSGQSASIIRGIAETQAQIANREVQLQVMRTYATDENPAVTSLQQGIATLRRQLADLENNQKNLQPGDVQLPAGRVPEAGLEYVRKYREVKYHETLFELLSKQYEAARIDEAKSAPLIQVVDRAAPPDKRSGPPRTLIAVGFALLGFLVAAAWAVTREVIRRMHAIPEQAARLAELSSSFRSR